MDKVRINLKKQIDESYDILIGSGLLENLPALLVKARLGTKYFIVTDTTTGKLFGKKLSDLMKGAGIATEIVTFVQGEKSKSREVKAKLEDEIIKFGAGRDSVIIALGGGVVGDIAGFVAATLFRGINYVQVPTTLLADVDSSVGGKTAIDHALGKNLIGAFHQPKLVVIDVSLLNSLPNRQIANGLAEIIKHALIWDIDLLFYIEDNLDKIYEKDEKVLIDLIKQNCAIKGKIVELDEKESGFRKTVNFGHTIGHAVETLSNFKLNHGEAIAIGMVAESKISQELGLLKQGEVDRIAHTLADAKLPVTIPAEIEAKDILKATLKDKKARKGVVEYVLLEGIGKAIYNQKVDDDLVLKVLIDMKGMK
ncbi:MAG: 3-dehydroquinate synthase [Nanoarchaeota archaeon]|nr:3-dehydroquinate synthase [Nanoarchaeota archaeon]